MNKKTPKDFESALRELEALTQEMDAGQMSLEQSLAAYARGIELQRWCQQFLDDAEQRLLVLEAEQGILKPLELDAPADD
jgi:exodeoxyribonuclease VII small subunit